jgi:hypothetical protein
MALNLMRGDSISKSLFNVKPVTQKMSGKFAFFYFILRETKKRGPGLTRTSFARSLWGGY